MPPEPNTPQPVIPFKMPHLTPVLDAPSPVVPESAAFLSLQQHLTEKANLEFMPVKFRTPEHRARLVIVKAHCEELEKQVMLERIDAQIARLLQEIQALQARPRKHGRRPGQIGARTRKQRLAHREAIAAKQAELSKLETAKAQLSGIAQVTQLHPMTRNQFLKMVGMTVLATAVWNRAAAAGGSQASSAWFSGDVTGEFCSGSFSQSGQYDDSSEHDDGDRSGPDSANVSGGIVSTFVVSPNPYGGGGPLGFHNPGFLYNFQMHGIVTSLIAFRALVGTRINSSGISGYWVEITGVGKEATPMPHPYYADFDIKDSRGNLASQRTHVLP